MHADPHRNKCLIEWYLIQFDLYFLQIRKMNVSDVKLISYIFHRY